MLLKSLICILQIFYIKWPHSYVYTGNRYKWKIYNLELIFLPKFNFKRNACLLTKRWNGSTLEDILWVTILYWFDILLSQVMDLRLLMTLITSSNVIILKTTMTKPTGILTVNYKSVKVIQNYNCIQRWHLWNTNCSKTRL